MKERRERRETVCKRPSSKKITNKRKRKRQNIQESFEGEGEDEVETKSKSEIEIVKKNSEERHKKK